MSETGKTASSRLELDKAFQYAVTLVWEDLKKPIEPRSIRVEYLCEPGTALDHLSVWSVRARGYQDLVCDYWTPVSSAHPTSMRFENGYYSDQLALTVEFIMNNQGQFTRPADAGLHGSVQIHPPDADDRTKATTWIKVVRALESERGSGEAPVSPEDHRQDEDASSRMDDEGYSSECAETLPDATEYSGYEWSPIS